MVVVIQLFSMADAGDTLAYSVLIVGFFVVIYLAKAKQAQCKPSRKEKPLLPLATPFNPLHIFFTKKTEDSETLPVQPSYPEVFELQPMTRSRRRNEAEKMIKI
jgi:hypothetical protein